MDKALDDLLGGILNEENRELISEAWSKRLDEARTAAKEEAEVTLREEFAKRYDHDKGILIEAMDRMLADVIKKELNEFQDDRREVLKQRARLAKATNEAKKAYKAKLQEHIKTLNTFVMKQLHEEVGEFSDDRKAIGSQRLKLTKAIVEAKNKYKAELAEHKKMLEKFIVRQLHEELSEFAQDRKLLAEQRVQMSKQLRESRIEYKKQLADRTKMLEQFILKQLTNEMQEFHTDKKALVESRVKFVREGKTKLEESRRNFVSKAAKMVEGTIDKVLRQEMTQFRDDIKQARENNFGRRLFEAFYTEFMTSHLSETTEMRKLSEALKEKEQKLNEAQAELKKHHTVLKETQSKLVRVEDGHKRTQVLNSLLGSLSRDKRAFMEELLSNVRTDNLKEAYRKYLPSVLAEDDKTVAQEGRKRLAESNKTAPKKTVAITGDRQNRLSESMLHESDTDNESHEELGQILHLAGIQGKEIVQ